MKRNAFRVEALAEQLSALSACLIGNKEQLDADLVSRGSTIWRLSRIGSAASKIGSGLRSRYHDVPWNEVVALRQLSDLDAAPTTAALWSAVVDIVPKLCATIDAMKMSARELDDAGDDGRVSDELGLNENDDERKPPPLTVEQIRKRRAEVERIAARYGASNVRIFGSVARGDARPGSDVDFLVDLEPGRSLFDLGGLQMDLEELFGRRVDVTHPRPGAFRDRISTEAVPL